MNDFLAARRARIADTLAPALGNALLLVGAGEPIPLPENTDQTYPFFSHAEYFYLAAHECPSGVIAFDPHDGSSHGWISFVPDIAESERVWEGRAQLPGKSITQLDHWIARRPQRAIVNLGAPLRGLKPDNVLTPRLRELFTQARRPKDTHEIALLRRCASATAAGYAALREHLRPGVTERALQIELEAGFFRGGATHTGYHSIVGVGSNSAILHFSPTSRAAREGDFVLVDAGGGIDRYVTDVTRTFVIGPPSAFQRDLYQIVLSTEERAIARCIPGAEWTAIHLAAAVELTAGLVDIGVLRGNPESLVEQEAHTLFFPHGIGHMVGLGVRDASGVAPSRTKDPRPSLRTLRMDLPLAPGYVVTVEPGLYFIPPLLTAPERRERFRDAVNWPLVDQHLHLGGIRIEDNLLITDATPENLTAAIPKTL